MTNTRTRKLSERASSILSVARNAALSGDDMGASFILAEQRSEVNRLASRGLLRVTSRGKWRGMTEVFAALTPAGFDALNS